MHIYPYNYSILIHKVPSRSLHIPPSVTNLRRRTQRRHYESKRMKNVQVKHRHPGIATISIVKLTVLLPKFLTRQLRYVVLPSSAVTFLDALLSKNGSVGDWYTVTDTGADVEVCDGILIIFRCVLLCCCCFPMFMLSVSTPPRPSFVTNIAVLLDAAALLSFSRIFEFSFCAP